MQGPNLAPGQILVRLQAIAYLLMYRVSCMKKLPLPGYGRQLQP